MSLDLRWWLRFSNFLTGFHDFVQIYCSLREVGLARVLNWMVSCSGLAIIDVAQHRIESWIIFIRLVVVCMADKCWLLWFGARVSFVSCADARTPL